jgi:cell division protein FtsI/penicillin-binding protein 2
MLTAVVHEGTSDRRRPIFLTAAGKTGTAQTGKTKEDGQEIFTAWFCGFYPADEPQYTICITMYDGGESYYSAAPVFKKICDSIYFLKYADNET